MITRFTEAEYAVEEADFRAETEGKAMAVVAKPHGYAVRPLSTVKRSERVIETSWPVLVPSDLA